MNKTPQKVPFLQLQKEFATDSMQVLGVNLDKTYIDIANRVNERIIGIFAQNTQIITGERWSLNPDTNQVQTLRKTFRETATFAHNIATANVLMFTRIYGVGYDGTNWFPLPYVDSTAANNQISIVVSPTQVVITPGGGTPPTLTDAIIVVEYLSNNQIS